MLRSAWTACRDAGALVVSLPTLWGAYIAQALGIPCIYALMQPLSRTAAFQCSLLPFQLPNWPALNRLSYFLVEQAVWLPWRGLLNDWLRSELRLRPPAISGPLSRLYENGATVLYAVSPSVISRPMDWPVNHRLTGFWFLEPATDWRPPARLVDFLAAGPAPLYFGFGSGGLRDPQVAQEAILRALEGSPFRALIHLPSQPSGALDPRRVYFTGDVPHTWLFPRCAGAVHHGGAGTTAAALRAGIPSLVVPQASDQFFWGRRVRSLGAGPEPIPQPALDELRLTGGLRRLADDPALGVNARRLSAAIQKEDGVRAAAAQIRDLL
jgi:sterol 3beta-glucosyltransferase